MVNTSQVSRCFVIGQLKGWIRILVFWGIVGATSAAWSDGHIDVYLEDDPVMSDRISKAGFALDILDLLRSRVHYTFNTHYFPLKRAQMMALRKQEAIILPLGRSPHLENRFHWIGPLVEFPVAFAQIESAKPLSTFEHALGLRGVGVVLGSPYEQLLQEQGVPYVAMENHELYGAFRARTLTTILGARPHIEATWSRLQDSSKLLFGATLSNVALWLAINSNSRTMNPERWQNEVEALKKTSVYDQMIKRYFDQSHYHHRPMIVEGAHDLVYR